MKCFCLLLLLISSVEIAQDGRLDGSFGTDGTVTTDFDGGSDSAGALVIQPDGKLVAAGSALSGVNNNFGLARYNPDGTLDTSFGPNGDGKVTTDFNGGNDVVNALILQPDGKLVAAGRATVSGINAAFGLARYNPDGTLDTSFGPNGDGKVTTDFGGGNDVVNALILQPDGKLVAAGRATVSSADFALVRYNPDGTLDSSFGPNGDGTVTTDFDGGSDSAVALILQPDGKLVAAGFATVSGGSVFGLARYNPDGTLDTSFGPNEDGKVTTDFGGGFDSANALILQPDGKLVAAGEASISGGSIDFGLARYNPDGTLDTSFGPNEDGKVTTDFDGGNEGGFALILQPDGKLVAAGEASISGGSIDFGLARYRIPSIEVSPLARNLRAKYQLLQPNAKNATEYNIS